jgi:hypothetical protein
MTANDEVERRGLRYRQTKALYPNHRSTPWLTEDAPRDRSNRLLEDAARRTQAIKVELPRFGGQFIVFVS